MKFNLRKLTEDQFELIEHIDPPKKKIIEDEDGFQEEKKVKIQKKSPYHVKFFLRDGQVTALSGNLILNNKEIGNEARKLGLKVAL
jgi:hypothetical protein